MQRDQRKHQSLEILHQVVEHSKSLWVGRVRHISQRADLCSLGKINRSSSYAHDRISYLELNVIAPEPDLQLLSTILVLLRPPRIVFFHDLAVFDDALDFGDEERADAHWPYWSVQNSVTW